MKKETQSESVKMEGHNFLMTSKKAAEYINFDYCNFRKQRNKGYFGRDRYPAPAFVFIGEGEQGIRYWKLDLDKWIENFPRHNNVALAFKETAASAAKSKVINTGVTV